MEAHDATEAQTHLGVHANEAVALLDGLALVRLFAHRREGVEHNAEDDVEEEHEHHNEEEQVEDGALRVRAVRVPG